MSNPLRNSNINYSDGWFFVTMQVAQNKTMFGVIAEGRCDLNALGQQIGACWEGMFERHPEAYRDEFVVMPNHFHAVIRIHPRATNKPNHLSYLMQGFKSFTTHLYHAAARAGLCPDIGACLWLSSYYDNLITTRRELDNIRDYVRNNPGRWDNDRFGPVTAHYCGNLELLHGELVAYVASEGWDTEVPPRDTDTEVPPRYRDDTEVPPRDTDTEVPPRDTDTEVPPRDT
ncbi:MAG: transposase, partial [Kiritimatiellae bacterium]|nr:transposase [Kiritimatiellia bacterium]